MIPRFGGWVRVCVSSGLLTPLGNNAFHRQPQPSLICYCHQVSSSASLHMAHTAPPLHHTFILQCGTCQNSNSIQASTGEGGGTGLEIWSPLLNLGNAVPAHKGEGREQIKRESLGTRRVEHLLNMRGTRFQAPASKILKWKFVLYTDSWVSLVITDKIRPPKYCITNHLVENEIGCECWWKLSRKRQKGSLLDRW